MARTYSLSGSITAAVQCTLTQTNEAALTADAEVRGSAAQQVWSVTDGTGDDQADDIFATKVTIAASGTYTVDLDSGSSEENDFGVALDWASCKMIFVRHDGTAGNGTVTVGGGSNPVLTNALEAMQPGDCDLIIRKEDGITVDATHKNILITNNDSSNANDVTIICAGVKS